MGAACYRIVVKDELGDAYARAFEGLTIETGDGETVMVGPISDQAQLQGILGRISSLNLVLLSINVLPGAGTTDPAL
jgi:hypothetical protein